MPNGEDPTPNSDGSVDGEAGPTQQDSGVGAGWLDSSFTAEEKEFSLPELVLVEDSGFDTFTKVTIVSGRHSQGQSAVNAYCDPFASSRLYSAQAVAL